MALTLKEKKQILTTTQKLKTMENREMREIERRSESTWGCEMDRLCWRKEERDRRRCNDDRRHRI